MKKRVITLNEGQLRRVIKNSVNRILRESCCEDFVDDASEETLNQFDDDVDEEGYNESGNMTDNLLSHLKYGLEMGYVTRDDVIDMLQNVN